MEGFLGNKPSLRLHRHPLTHWIQKAPSLRGNSGHVLARGSSSFVELANSLTASQDQVPGPRPHSPSSAKRHHRDLVTSGWTRTVFGTACLGVLKAGKEAVQTEVDRWDSIKEPTEVICRWNLETVKQSTGQAFLLRDQCPSAWAGVLALLQTANLLAKITDDGPRSSVCATHMGDSGWTVGAWPQPGPGKLLQAPRRIQQLTGLPPYFPQPFKQMKLITKNKQNRTWFVLIICESPLIVSQKMSRRPTS